MVKTAMLTSICDILMSGADTTNNNNTVVCRRNMRCVHLKQSTAQWYCIKYTRSVTPTGYRKTFPTQSAGTADQLELCRKTATKCLNWNYQEGCSTTLVNGTTHRHCDHCRVLGHRFRRHETTELVTKAGDVKRMVTFSAAEPSCPLTAILCCLITGKCCEQLAQSLSESGTTRS